MPYITNINVDLDLEELALHKDFGKFSETIVKFIDAETLADELENRGWQVAAPEEEFSEEEDTSEFQKRLDEVEDYNQRRLDAYREERAWT